MRQNSVPCKHATDYEIARNIHLTWNDDRVCDPCRNLLDVLKARRISSVVQEPGSMCEVLAIRDNAKARHPAGNRHPEH